MTYFIPIYFLLNLIITLGLYWALDNLFTDEKIDKIEEDGIADEEDIEEFRDVAYNIKNYRDLLYVPKIKMLMFVIATPLLVGSVVLTCRDLIKKKFK